MSRSNPNENGNPNPAQRWFEWNGEHGSISYYDKDQAKSIDCGSDFTFMLLDRLGSVRGWHDASNSGIYSNEVKDTRQEVLVVKSFKGGTLAEGVYKYIKDKVNSQGGQFVASCYIAFKLDEKLSIGNIRFKGAALGAWMEFEKANRSVLYKKAIGIRGFTEGKKGRVTFRVPVLKTADISADTDAAATALDRELQEFLKGYLAKNKREAAETAGRHVSDEEIGGGHFEEPPMEPITDDDIPFAWLLPFLLPAALALHTVLA
jgi:hypothetical protein